MDVSGVILSAGESKRMGEPKALLLIEGRAIIDHIVEQYLIGGVSEVVVVVNPEIYERVKKSLHKKTPESVKIVINENYKKGMFSSMQKGVNEAKFDNVLLGLVDNPLIDANTVCRLIKSFNKHYILIPTYMGRKGHPVIFGKEVKEEIIKAPVENTMMKDIFQKFGDLVRFIEFDTQRILVDMDSKDDYERILKQWKK